MEKIKYPLLLNIIFMYLHVQCVYKVFATTNIRYILNMDEMTEDASQNTYFNHNNMQIYMQP